MRVPRSSRPLLVLGDSEELAGIWALASLGLFVVTAVGFGALDLWLHGTLQIGWLDAVAGLVLTILAHEGVHALGVLVGGARPRLVAGIQGIWPHLHVGSDGHLTRNGALVTMLAPLVVVDLLGLALLLVPTTSGTGLIVLVGNTMGSVPGLWRAFQLLRLPRWVECEECGAAMRVWVPPDRQREACRLQRGRLLEAPPLLGIVGTWVLCVLVAEAVCAGVVRILAQVWGGVTIGRLTLASTEQFISGSAIILGFWPLVLVGAALGTVAAAVWVLVAVLLQRAARRAEEPRRLAA